jgi:hypothetical protein
MLTTWSMFWNLVIVLKFAQILAIENLLKHLILAILILNITFWLYIASKKKGWVTHYWLKSPF